jgi:Na+/citrate or Na+/malate symporter
VARDVIRMSDDVTKWDRWAPTLYLFIVGLVVGYVMGFASGILSGGSTSFWVLIIPVIVIVIAFIAFGLAARTIGRKPST